VIPAARMCSGHRPGAMWPHVSAPVEL
jgi:hypothetical protein